MADAITDSATTTRPFTEGFDNILTFDYDAPYRNGTRLTADSLLVGVRPATPLHTGWHFAPDLFHSAERSRWFEETLVNQAGEPLPYDFSFDSWEPIAVPSTWNAQRPEYALYEGCGLYTTTFSATPPAPNRRMFLKIGAANYETRLWLNQQYLGRHLGGFTPFCVDITSLLCGENRLLVSVDNTRKEDQLPSLHYDWFNYGGIHRAVELIETPSIYVRGFTLSLTNDGRALHYTVTVGGATYAENAAQGVDALLCVPELGLSQTVVCTPSSAKDTGAPDTLSADGMLILPTDSPLQRWSLQAPKLYAASCTLLQSGDILHDEIGFRTLAVQGTQIMLNGESVFLKGMCVHEESPDHLRAVTQADIEDMLHEAKALGCNFLRLTHYPHNELVSRLADRMGLLLWEEIPVYWALDYENPNTWSDASNQLTELIRRDQNRASVIFWSIGNETPDSNPRFSFMRRLAQRARAEDASRLLAASCLIDLDACKIQDRLTDVVDVVGVNEYYGWYLKDFTTLTRILQNSAIGKPVIITETGADAVCGQHSDTLEMYSEEYQAEVYRRQFEILLQFPYLRGVTPWVLYDYASMRRMSCLQKGYNLKGIISADRKHHKLAYGVVKRVYEGIR